MLREDGYTETFTLSADLEDGGFAQIQLGVTNMGPGSGRAICRVLLVSPAATWRSQMIASPGEWHYGANLDIAGCSASGGERPSFVAKTGEGSLEISVATDSGAGAGKEYQSQGKPGSFTIYPLAAGARAKVTILVQDRIHQAPARHLSARAYLEHDVGTVTPDTIGRQWFRFRTVDGAGVRYGIAHRYGKQNEGVGQFASQSTSAVESQKLTIQAHDEPGAGVVVFTSAKGTITLRPVRTIAEYAPLREMGFMGRLLSAIVGNPVLTILEVTWEEGAFKQKAVLEVTTFR